MGDAGEYDRRVPEVPSDPPKHRQPVVASPFFGLRAHSIGDHAHAAAGDARLVRGALQARMETVHGARLLDVEGFARGRIARGIDEQDAADLVVGGERLRGRTAYVTGADDRDGLHALAGWGGIRPCIV